MPASESSHPALTSAACKLRIHASLSVRLNLPPILPFILDLVLTDLVNGQLAATKEVCTLMPREASPWRPLGFRIALVLLASTLICDQVEQLNHISTQLASSPLQLQLLSSKGEMPSIIEGAPAHGTVAHLLPPSYKRMVALWLEEDTPSFDYGGFVVGEGMAEARLLGKSEGVLAGVPFFDEVFRQLDCT